MNNEKSFYGLRLNARTFFFIIIGTLAAYRGISIIQFVFFEYDADSAIDFKNIYLASFNLIKGINPYDDFSLKNTWQNMAQSQGYNILEIPGKPDLPFIYPPWTPFIFIPFASIPYGSAVTIWYTILISTYLFTPFILIKTFGIKFSLATYIEIFILIIAFKATKGSFLVGQPAYFSFLLSISSIYLYKKEKYILAGLLLGVASFKISVAFAFYFFYFFSILKHFSVRKLFDFNALKTLSVSIGFIALCTFSEGLLLSQSPIQSIIDFKNVLANFQEMYCNRTHDDYSILKSSTEWIILLRYFLGFGVCHYFWMGNLLFCTILAFIWFSKAFLNWSDARLILALSLSNLLSMYHLYHDAIGFILFFFIWEELSKKIKIALLSIILFDLLISHVKILAYFNIQIPILVEFNNYELPLRILIMLVVVCFYCGRKDKILAKK